LAARRGELGSAVWLGFLVAMVAALLTGLSYASLGSRYRARAVRPMSPRGPTTARC
jgi:amino acid transporter